MFMKPSGMQGGPNVGESLCCVVHAYTQQIFINTVFLRNGIYVAITKISGAKDEGLGFASAFLVAKARCLQVPHSTFFAAET